MQQNTRPDIQISPKTLKILPLIYISSQKFSFDAKASRQKLLMSRLKVSSLQKEKKNKYQNLLSVKRYQRILKAQKKMSTLNHRLGASQQTEMKYLFSSFKSLSSLSSLFLSFAGFSYQKAKSSTISLFKKLASLKNLENVDFSFISIKLQDPKILLTLLKSLQKIKTLASLSLTFDKNSLSNKLIFQKFLQYLSRLTQLRILRLNLAEINSLKMNSLALVFTRLSQLTKIDLDWPIRANRLALQNLFKSFQTINKTLSDLTLNLDLELFKNTRVLSETLALFDCPSLKRLKITLNGGVLDERCLELLSLNLRKCATLMTNLCLKIPHITASITNNHVQNFIQTLSHLRLLSALEFTFPQTPYLLQDIGFALGQFESLVSLKLCFIGECQVTDHQYQHLFLNIRNLLSLEFLKIEFSHTKTLTGKSLFILAGTLKNLILLKDLTFRFSTPSFVTRAGVEVLIDSIKNLVSLRKLSLKLDCSIINHKTLEKIGQTLQSLPSLNQLELFLSQYPKNLNLGTIFEAIETMEFLQTIALGPYCYGVASLEVSPGCKIKEFVRLE